MTTTVKQTTHLVSAHLVPDTLGQPIDGPDPVVLTAHMDPGLIMDFEVSAGFLRLFHTQRRLHGRLVKRRFHLIPEGCEELVMDEGHSFLFHGKHTRYTDLKGSLSWRLFEERTGFGEHYGKAEGEA